MKGKRLGRSLEDISHVFLSSERTGGVTDNVPERRQDPKPSAPAPAASIHAIGVSGCADHDLGIFTLGNIAIELARQGYRVLVVDDDPGRPNVTRLMGLMDIANPAETVLNNAPMGVRVTYRTPFQNEMLSRPEGTLPGSVVPWLEKYRRFDFILFHLADRCLGEMAPLLSNLSGTLFVVPSDAEGMLEAYASIKAFHRYASHVPVGLTVTCGQGEAAAEDAFRTMSRNVRRFLKKDLVSYAFIEKHRSIGASISEGVPLVLKWPTSEIRRHLYNIAGLMINDFVHQRLSEEECP